MSCNGCRVLRKGCSDSCSLRSSLKWIDCAEAQAHATVFVAKFFGRAGLMSFISNVSDNERPALFQSLLYEACGRTVNPVHGAVGLLCSGNWHICEAAVDSILKGGALSPVASVPETVPFLPFDCMQDHFDYEADLVTMAQKRKFDEDQPLRDDSFMPKNSRNICVSKSKQEEQRIMQFVAPSSSRSRISEGINDAQLSLSLSTLTNQAMHPSSHTLDLELSLNSCHTPTPGSMSKDRLRDARISKRTSAGARISSPTSVTSVASEGSMTSLDTVDPHRPIISSYPKEDPRLLDLLL